MVLNLPANERVEGTAAVVAISIAHGADIVRVHDVAGTLPTVKILDAIVNSEDRRQMKAECQNIERRAPVK